MSGSELIQGVLGMQCATEVESSARDAKYLFWRKSKRCAVWNVSDSHNVSLHISQRNLCPRFVTQQNAVASCYLDAAQSDSVPFGPIRSHSVSFGLMHIDLWRVEFTGLGNWSRVVTSQSRPGIVDYPKVQLRTQTLCKKTGLSKKLWCEVHSLWVFWSLVCWQKRNSSIRLEHELHTNSLCL